MTIRDEIRTSAAETIGYFNEQGVTLNVISGDDPRTVSSIARAVGVPGADAYVDATTLDTPSKIDAAVDRYHVFGRVTPQQKRELVQALKRRDHTVAMTGDGVNDVLALKEPTAPCHGRRFRCRAQRGRNRAGRQRFCLDARRGG